MFEPVFIWNFTENSLFRIDGVPLSNSRNKNTQNKFLFQQEMKTVSTIGRKHPSSGSIRPEVFCLESCFENSQKKHRKTPVVEAYFIKSCNSCFWKKSHITDKYWFAPENMFVKKNGFIEVKLRYRVTEKRHSLPQPRF